MKILTLHGINLNMFGKRDPKTYGTTTLAEIDAQLVALGQELGAEAGDHIEDDRGDQGRQRAPGRPQGRGNPKEADAEQHARGGNPNRDIRVGGAKNQRPARDELSRRR